MADLAADTAVPGTRAADARLPDQGIPSLRRRRLLPNSVQGMLLLLLAVALLPALAVQGFIYRGEFEARRQQESQANLELARASALAFEAFVQDVLHQEAAIGRAIADGRFATPEEINAFLVASAREYRAVRDYGWIAPPGRVLYSSLPAAIGATTIGQRSYYQAVAQGREWVVADLTIANTSGRVGFPIMRGIRNRQGVLQGTVHASVEPGSLGSVLGVGRAGDASISLVDRQGMLVYRYPEVERTWEERDWLKLDPTLARALAGEESMEVVPGTDGHSRLTTRVPIRSLGWVVQASRPLEEIAAPIRDDLLRDGALNLLVALAALVVALAISRSLTSPLGRLRGYALAVARGERPTPPEIAFPAELAQLSAGSTYMVDQLRRQEEQLREINERLVITGLERAEAAGRAVGRAAELETALTALRELQERQEEYVNLISHDLRAPLTVVQGHAQLLQRRAHDPQAVVQGAEAIYTSSRRMAAMIQDLVDSARLEAGQFPLFKMPLELAIFQEELKTRLGGALEAERIRVEAPGEPITVLADPNRIERVMTNLLSNALKYSPHAGEVLVRMERRDDQVIISVVDRGPGIPPEEQERIFDRFYRAQPSGKTEGLGLGLYICRLLVEAHNGSIWVESAPGQGSTFRFTLPVAE